MDVTSDNFIEQLSTFQNALDNADFISFDNEFTGLHRSRSQKPTAGDTFQSRWEKVRDSAISFEVLQFGVCTFKWNVENSLEVRPFNFWTFPDSLLGEPDRVFMVQAGSLRFLRSCNFDFNKCISKGISYLNVEDASHERKRLEQKLEQRAAEAKEASTGSIASQQIPLDRVDEAQKSIVESFINDVKQSMAKLAEEDCNFESLTVTTASMNSFVRRVCYQQAESISASRIFLASTGDGPHKGLTATIFSSDEAMKAFETSELRKKLAKDIEKLQLAIGMGDVIQRISKSKKTIVGHNCFLDLALIMEKFLEPLPIKYSEFCSRLKHFFPRVVDTKHVLCKGSEFQGLIGNTSLGQAYSTTKKWENMPQYSFPPEFQNYEEQEHLHEAAYDSFITGAVYASCCRKVQPDISIQHPQLDDSLANCLHLMRLPVPLKINGENRLIRTNWLRVEGFPARTKTHQLISLFENFQNSSDNDAEARPIRIIWESDTVAFVVMANPAAVGRAISASNSISRDTVGSSTGDNKQGNETLQLGQVRLSAFESQSTASPSGGTKRKRLGEPNEDDLPPAQRSRNDEKPGTNSCALM